ncbi:MAG TPA: metallophosphoesterase, partial [Erysipelothrix sp.]|nr:metallophosphoesterase [Erysipelothrix sp.]
LSSYFFNHKLMRKLTEMIIKEKVDVLIIGGDVIHKKCDYYHAFDYLKEIDVPKIAVLGNHDYKDIDGIKKAHEEAGITLLVNETMTFKGITFVGVDDLREGHPQIPPLNKHDINILLTHEPDVFHTVSSEHEFDMTLAGHHHAGQITFFGLFAPILPSIYKQKYHYGLVKQNGQTIYVSSGLGGYVFILPIRFFAQPELVIITNENP